MKTPSKNAAVTILISNQVDFRKRKITRDKERNYIVIKGQFTKNTKQFQICMHLTTKP